MPSLHLPSTISRSTPRVRLTTAAMLGCIVLVSCTGRATFGGVAGGILAAGGFLLVLVAALGRAWTSLFIAGFKDTHLVVEGPYAACRHPLYALSLLGTLGFGLGTRSLVLATALLGLAVLLHVRDLRAEDAILERLHGDAARRYRATVPALMPDWGRYTVPATLEIRPRVVWKAIVDAAASLAAYALLQLAHAAQVNGVTPTWFELP